MAALDLNTVRQTIEARLATEMASSPAITTIFANQPFTPTSETSFVQCLVNFGSGEYLTLGGTSDSANSQIGNITINIFTKIGVGLGDNLTIAKRIRDLYNRVVISDLYFEPPEGPNVLEAASPQGFVQSVLSVTFFSSAFASASCKNFSNAVSYPSFLVLRGLPIIWDPIKFSEIIPFCFKIVDASLNVAAFVTKLGN